MEIILATVVASAVIFFGALISMGNERQRKAIDGLREQVILWAVQDLSLKRESLAKDVKMDNPLAWLNQLVTKIYGTNLDLSVTDFSESPRMLACMTMDGRKMFFSPMSLKEIHRLLRERKNKLSKADINYQLIDLRRIIFKSEVSILNGGILFDIELRMAWMGLTNQNINQIDRIWMYLTDK